MAEIERKKFKTSMELRYNGVTFTIHHLVLAKSLQEQKQLFSRLTEKLDKLSINIRSFEETSLDPDSLEFSEEDKKRLMNSQARYHSFSQQVNSSLKIMLQKHINMARFCKFPTN